MRENKGERIIDRNNHSLQKLDDTIISPHCLIKPIR